MSRRRPAGRRPSALRARPRSRLTPRRPRLVRRFSEVRPEGLGSHGPMPSPTISRRPSVLAATAIIAATETMRPPAHLQVGRIQPQIGPVAFERTFQEGLHALVDFLAQFRDPALRDAGKPHRLRDFVDPARRHPADPGLLDDGDQRLFRRLARLQERREVAAGPSFGILRLSEPSRVSSVRSR